MRAQLNFKFLVILALIMAIPTSQVKAATMIATEQVVSDMSLERDRVQAFVHRTDIEKKLQSLGVSPEEATKRVASLSDDEVKKISGRLDALHAGGDGIYLGLGALILLAILIVLLVRR